MNRLKTEELIRQVWSWSSSQLLEAHQKLMSQTPLFDVEIASVCNIHCAFCPRHVLSRKTALMNDETFKHLLSFLPTNAMVMLSGMGEATLHPQLATFVYELTQRKISTCMITNGIRLYPSLQKQLFEAGISQIQISVHGLDLKDLSGIIIRGAQPSKVLQNLEFLAREKPDHLRVRLNVVEPVQHPELIEKVKQLARHFEFEFFWRRQHSRAGALTLPVYAQPMGCGIFSAVTFISVDGEILPCVNDVESQYRLGNVRNLQWKDVLDWKKDVIVKKQWFPICSKCDDDYRWVLLGQGQLDE